MKTKITKIIEKASEFYYSGDKGPWNGVSFANIVFLTVAAFVALC